MCQQLAPRFAKNHNVLVVVAYVVDDLNNNGDIFKMIFMAYCRLSNELSPFTPLVLHPLYPEFLLYQSRIC